MITFPGELPADYEPSRITKRDVKEAYRQMGDFADFVKRRFMLLAFNYMAEGDPLRHRVRKAIWTAAAPTAETDKGE